MINSHPLIEFKNIIKAFKGRTVLMHLNLEIFESEIVGLLGKSGCGKSTLLKILLGFYPPDRGTILFRGEDLSKNYIKIRRIAGFVSQENSFYEKLTVEENLKFFAQLYKVKRSEIKPRINYLLNLVKLTQARNTLANNISGGMKRRLEFAISLIHNPVLLILDEPFTGLDIEIRNELWRVIEEIKHSGVTVIICTHLLSSAQNHCDRIVIMHNQRIKEQINLKVEHIPNLETKFLEVTSQ